MHQNWISVVVGAILCAFLAVLAANILWRILVNDIDLSSLLSGADGGASLSRLQLLIFTFVIAISFLMLVEKGGTFPEVPNNVLLLLGISASTYAVGKSISVSDQSDPAAAAQAGAVAGAVTGAQTGAATGAQAGAVTGTLAGAEAGAVTGAVMGGRTDI